MTAGTVEKGEPKRGENKADDCPGQVFLVTFQCNPPAAKWNDSVSSYTCAIDTGRFFLATVTTHLILDILLMVIPACEPSGRSAGRERRLSNDAMQGRSVNSTSRCWRSRAS